VDKVHEEKFNFVRHELLRLLKAIDKDILKTEYDILENEIEIVTVYWLTSEGHSSDRKVNVTGDSLQALARDVLKWI